MKRIFKSQFWAMLLVAAMAVGCAEDPIEELGGAESLGEPVAVSLSLTAEAMEAGTAEAKSLATRAEESSAIKNLWVFQVNGTKDADFVVGKATYIEDYKEGESKAYLIPTGTRKNTIVYLANTYDPNITVYSGSTTLGNLKTLSKIIGTEAECYTEEGDKKYLMMSGFHQGVISGATPLTDELKFNLAKIDVNIENYCNDLQIKSAQFVNVAKQFTYFTNQPGGVVAPYPPGVTTFNYDVQELTFEDSKASLSTYVTANMQGESDESLDQTTKPLYAPRSATYLAIYAYDETTKQDVTYKMYLGADMIDDYNIEANKHYTYTFTFNSVGQIGSDSRIETMKPEVDYRERESSNCYIINPSMVSKRVYYIPVANRIYDFWAGYAQTPGNNINEDKTWKVEVLWYDCDENPIGADASSLTSKTLFIEPIREQDNVDMQQSVKVTLGEKFDNYGNVIFAVKKASGEILWSWHLWITDYNPDSKTWQPETNKYRYPTAGGEIQRYKDDKTGSPKLWDGGSYANTFIMDRSIGARGVNYEESTAGALFYQWGRKDPFPALYGKYYDNGSKFNVNSSAVAGPVGIEVATLNPMIFYTKGDTNTDRDWCTYETGIDFDWRDNNSPKGSEIKSIFDPSPLGWKVPSDNTWQSFNDDGGTAESTIFPWSSIYYNRTYTIDGNPIAIYPAQGRIDRWCNYYNNTKTENLTWSSTPSTDNDNSYCLQGSATNIVPAYSFPRSYGMQVRPVKYTPVE